MLQLSLRTAIVVGLVYAAILSAVAFFGVAVAGGEFAGMTIGTIASLYFDGGIVGGFLLWRFQELAQSRLGGALLGFLCMLPLALGSAVAMQEPDGLALRLTSAVVVSGLIGGSVGYAESARE